MSTISFNPMTTSQPQSSFLATTEGYVQGAFWDDPSSNMWQVGGYVDSSVTQPVWGGMAITEDVATVNSNAQGNAVKLASTAGNFTGLTVFNRAYNMVITPGNTVQQAGAGMSVMYFRVGSNARIAVQVLSTLVASLEGGAVNQALYWDPALQQLTASGTSGAFQLPATTKLISLNSNSKIVSYNSGTGAVTWTTGNAAIIQI